MGCSCERNPAPIYHNAHTGPDQALMLRLSARKWRAGDRRVGCNGRPPAASGEEDDDHLPWAYVPATIRHPLEAGPTYDRAEWLTEG